MLQLHEVRLAATFLNLVVVAVVSIRCYMHVSVYKLADGGEQSLSGQKSYQSHADFNKLHAH